LAQAILAQVKRLRVPAPMMVRGSGDGAVLRWMAARLRQFEAKQHELEHLVSLLVQGPGASGKYGFHWNVDADEFLPCGAMEKVMLEGNEKLEENGMHEEDGKLDENAKPKENGKPEEDAKSEENEKLEENRKPEEDGEPEENEKREENGKSEGENGKPEEDGKAEENEKLEENGKHEEDGKPGGE